MRAIFLMRADQFDEVYRPDDRCSLAKAHGQEPPLVTPETFARRLPELGRVEYIFSGWGCPLLDLAARRAMPGLKAVFHAAGTIRGVVAPDLWATGVRVSSAAEANAGPVADYTYAAAVFASKFVWQQAAAARSRRIFTPPRKMGLYGSAVGLIAFSKVGRKVAERMLACGARVLVYDPHLSDEEAARRGVEKIASVGELFALSDIVSCHAPSLPETRWLVRGRDLRRLRPGGHFINTSRGAVVAEGEMVEILRQRPDLSATLDVTTEEPLSPDSPLRDLPNVALTPHIAGSLDRECRRLGLFAIEEHARYERGEALQGEVSAESLATVA